MSLVCFSLLMLAGGLAAKAMRVIVNFVMVHEWCCEAVVCSRTLLT